MLKPAAGAAALGVPLGSEADASAVLATYAAQQPSLSIVKGWDALNLLAAPMRRRKGSQASARIAMPVLLACTAAHMRDLPPPPPPLWGLAANTSI